MTSQVRSKSKWLTIWRIWFYRTLQPYQMEMSKYNNMGRVCDTSKYHPKPSLSIFKVTRPKKGQTKNFVFGRLETYFKVSFSSWLWKMTLKHFLNGPNGTKIENRENTEILVITVKMAVFELQSTKTCSFVKISTWNLTYIDLTGFFHLYFGFWKFENLFGLFGYDIYWLLKNIVFKIW